MPFFGFKEPLTIQNYKIYRGKDPDVREKDTIKTEDFIEDLGTQSDKLWWATKTGLKAGLLWSVFEISHLSRLTDRRAQLARAAFFTIPIVGMSVGWMGGLEITKKMFGREHWLGAQFVAASVPAGIYAFWRKRPLAFAQVWVALGLVGVAHQYAVDNDFTIYKPALYYNPNEAITYYDMKANIFQTSEKPNLGTISDFYRNPPQPTWKKFEE